MLARNPLSALLLHGILFLSFAASAKPIEKPTGLQCEHLVSPLGIDATNPRFTWQICSSTQSAYAIYVGTDSANIVNQQAAAWLSGKITSTKQLAVYHGAPLKPFTKYYWAVQVWDDGGKQYFSEVSNFETGMVDVANWKGAWIQDSRDINLKPAAYFRKAFPINKKIVSARAYIAVAGLYELSINGQRIGDHRLDPMFTRFDRRTLYVTYDITANMQQGNNVIGVLLGNGWYNLQSTAVWYFDKAPWRGRQRFCMDVRITYGDGTVETVSSGIDWKTTFSPVVFNSIYTGEHYDARLEIPHWNESSYNDSAWKNAVYCAAPSQLVTAEAMVPIRDVRAIPAASVRKFNDTDYVFNIGRNIAGVSQLTVSGPKGTIVRVKHAELLDSLGHVDQSNIIVHYRPTDNTDPFQTDIYILNGNGDETFKPRFNYKGFQYVEVTSTNPVTLNKESLTAYFMHSDVKQVGYIHTSNPTINKIWDAANSSYLSNLFGYPTDCPQREKNGWTGDAQGAVETGLYNFDGITVYEKWLADHRDEQQPNGVLPNIIPTSGWGYDWANGPDWTSSLAIIPWKVYLFYGDSKLLHDCYSNIKRYIDYINMKYPSGICYWGLGDWLPVKSVSPVEFTSTAYYYTDVVILANAAKLFGNDADYQTYTTLAQKIKDAFNKKYLDPATGNYADGLQTELSVALFWKMVPDNYIAKTAALLAKRVIDDGPQVDVGLLGSKSILNALSENGYADLAYKLASREKFPSWGWWIVNGATTLYENWHLPSDIKNDMSLNHIMFGEISAWFYKALGGIMPDPSQPGFKHILLQPHFVQGLDSFECSHESPYGTIVSKWKREGKSIIYAVTIPPGSSATLTLPNQTKELQAGSYTFEVK